MSDVRTHVEETEATPFWRFSLSFYRQAGVADACIALQDDCGVDVNLLLFLLWLADDGRLVSDAEVRKLDDMVRDWRNLTIIPLRDTRRKLKGAHTAVDPGQQEAFRNKLKAIELEAERLQQRVLYASIQSGSPGRRADPHAAVRGNISIYERLIGAVFPQARVDVLLDAFDSIAHGGVTASAAVRR